MKKKLLKTLLLAVGMLVGENAWAVDVPTPVYFNDFSSTTGLTIVGSGEFTTDANAHFGAIYRNNPAKNTAPRTNYLKLPESTLTHSGTTNAMTIGFWVNKMDAKEYKYYPLFSAYKTSTQGADNGSPMFVCQARGILQVNDGNGNWSDFTATNNDAGANTESVDWLNDSEWHYYTVTLTSTKAIVYVDGAVVNSWTMDGTSSGQVISGLFSAGAAGNYPVVCLGGNQAWGWIDEDPAFAFDDFAVYDAALSADQINEIIDKKYYPVTQSWDFKSFVAAGSKPNLTNSGVSVGKNNKSDIYRPSNYQNDLGGKFAMQFRTDVATEWSLRNTDADKGLCFYNSNKDEYFSILGLHAGDVVTVTLSSGQMYFSEAANCTGTYISKSDYTTETTGTPTQWDKLKSGADYTINADGALHLQAKKTWAVISSIIVKSTAAETMTAPVISSEANGDARTVTIASGTSNLLSGYKTYYTTDNSEPTAASTLYTAPFDVNATTTIKAITISNSSVATTSSVTTELIDMDVIDTPTASITAVDGVNRTVTFTCPTDGVTLSYSLKTGEDTWADYVTASSLVISSNTTLKVKATKNAKETVSGELAFEAGTAITLNAPSYAIGAYSEGTYTLTLTTTQKDKLLSPTASIKYTVNSGATETLTSGETVSATVGSTYKFWSEATGYTNSAEITVVPTYIDLSTYRTDWSNDFDALAKAIATETNSSANVTKSEDELISGYYNITNSGFSAKFGVNNVVWQVRNTGSGKTANTGLWPYNVSGSMVITELTAGDVIVFDGDPVSAGTNVVKDEFVSTANSNYTFVVSADGYATFTPTKSGYIHSVTVYTLRPANISKTISSAGWATLYTPYALNFAGTGLTAYTATYDDEKSTVTLTEVNNVPKNTGIVLKGDADTYSIPVIASSSTAQGSLEGNASAATAYNAFDGYDLYMLALNDSDEAQFTKVTSGSIAAGKAFLKVSSAGGARILKVVFDETTGIKAIEDVKSADNKAYNLNGQRVSQPSKGLYIINGKKVIVK